MKFIIEPFFLWNVPLWNEDIIRELYLNTEETSNTWFWLLQLSPRTMCLQAEKCAEHFSSTHTTAGAKLFVCYFMHFFLWLNHIITWTLSGTILSAHIPIPLNDNICVQRVYPSWRDERRDFKLCRRVWAVLDVITDCLLGKVSLKETSTGEHVYMYMHARTQPNGSGLWGT